MPGAAQLRQIVHADFNRSGGAGRDGASLLDADQRTLVDDLRSGAALTNPVAPTSTRALELLAEYNAVEKEKATLRGDVEELDSLLRATFESRTWRLGRRLTSLRRRGAAVTTYDRWQESRKKRRERVE